MVWLSTCDNGAESFNWFEGTRHVISKLPCGFRRLPKPQEVLSTTELSGEKDAPKRVFMLWMCDTKKAIFPKWPPALYNKSGSLSK
jgi:hypothetical protein